MTTKASSLEACPCLAVESGGQARHSFVLNKAVIRVGSHRDCQVRLDDVDVEPHALTIENRNGRIHVHNRTDRLLTLDAKALAPHATRPWPPDESLQLTPALRLQLVGSGSEASLVPSAGASSGAFESSETWPRPGPDRGHGSGAERLAALIPLTLLALAVAVAGPSFQARGPAPVATDSDGIARLVLELRQSGDEGRSVAQEIQLVAQEKRLGKSQAARVRLLRLRDRVLKQRGPDGRFPARRHALEDALRWIADAC
jgi:hypothetical protein